MLQVSKPWHSEIGKSLAKKELENLNISGLHSNFEKLFEDQFAKIHNSSYAIACSSGTAALHLALHSLGIGPGDEVICTNTTNMASFFSIIYTGAKPVPVDITGKKLQTCIHDIRNKITDRTKAIMIVHLFGMPNNMLKICEIAKENNLLVIEDCAEAHGSSWQGQLMGTFGDIGCFSFFANKNINCGEGGMCITNNPIYAEKIKSGKSLSFGDKEKFMHKGIGFNYRLNAMSCALGFQQSLEFDELIYRRIRICEIYNELFLNEDLTSIIPEHEENGVNTYWMYLLIFEELSILQVRQLRQYLFENKIETREGFIPFSMQKNIELTKEYMGTCPNSEQLAYKYFYIPTFLEITEQEQIKVVKTIKDYMRINNV